MAKTGRPSKFTSETTEALIQFVENGMTLKDAAELCGLHYSTVAAWRAKGEEEGDGPFYEFSVAIKRADVAFKRFHLNVIASTARGEPILDENGCVVGYKRGAWQASAWLLERKYWKEFGRKDRHEIAGDMNEPIPFAFVNDFDGV